MPRLYLLELWLRLPAAVGATELLVEPAPGMEAAAGRRVRDRGGIAEHERSLRRRPLGPDLGRRDETDRVGMRCTTEEGCLGSVLHDAAQVHHDDPVGQRLCR